MVQPDPGTPQKELLAFSSSLPCSVGSVLLALVMSILDLLTGARPGAPAPQDTLPVPLSAWGAFSEHLVLTPLPTALGSRQGKYLTPYLQTTTQALEQFVRVLLTPSCKTVPVTSQSCRAVGSGGSFSCHPSPSPFGGPLSPPQHSIRLTSPCLPLCSAITTDTSWLHQPFCARLLPPRDN